MSSSSSSVRRSPAAAGGPTARRDTMPPPSRSVMPQQHPPPHQPYYPYPHQQQQHQQQDYYLQPPPPAAAQRHADYFYYEQQQQQQQHHHEYPYQYQDPSSLIITPDAQQQQNLQQPPTISTGGSITAATHHQNAWQSMTRTLAHYDVCEQIGEGTYGQVYRGLCKDTGQTVALKKMRIHHGGYWGMPLQLVREIKILKRLHHPNLLQLIEVVTSKGVEHLDPDDPPKQSVTAKAKKADEQQQQSDAAAVVSDREDPHESYKGNLFLVLEYVSHDLTGLIDTCYEFQPVHIKCIVKQLLQALAYMHQNKYIHRDIKTSNVLLDEYFRLKLADFGLARSMEQSITEQLQPAGSSGSSSKEPLTNKVITLWYRPPEILVGATNYGPAVDVWSAGCILAELMLGKPLFAGKTELDQFNLIVDMLGTPDEATWKYLPTLCKKGRSVLPVDFASSKPSRLREKYGKKMPPSAMSLLEKLLEWDPRKRLTAKNALEQRYFWVEPVAPDDPSQLGRVLKEGVHFHEFQTKKKRKQAKAKAEVAREEALKNGGSDGKAQAAFDEVYRGMMKQVAEEGFAFEEPETVMATAVEVAQNRARAPSSDNIFEDESSRRDRRRSSSRNRDDHRRSRRDGDRKREEDRRTGTEEHKKKDERLHDDLKDAVEDDHDQSKRRRDDRLASEGKSSSRQSGDRPAEKQGSQNQEEPKSRGNREGEELPHGEQDDKGKKRHRRDRSRKRKDKRRRDKKDDRGEHDRGERDREHERDRHREREREERDRMARDRTDRDRSDRRRDYEREHGRNYGREHDRSRDMEFQRDAHRDRHRDWDRPLLDERGGDDRYRDRGPHPPGPDDGYRRFGQDDDFRRYGRPGHRNDLPPPDDRGHVGRHPAMYDDQGRRGDRGRDDERYPDRPRDRERDRGAGAGGRDRGRR